MVATLVRSIFAQPSTAEVRSIKRSLQRRHLHPAEPRAKGEPSPCKQGEGHGRHPGSLERVPTNPPAYGAWNGRKVAMGTGESLLGPGTCGVLGKRCLTYNRVTGRGE